MICFDGEGVPPEVAKLTLMHGCKTKMCSTPGFPPAFGPSARLAGRKRPPILKNFYPNSILVTGHDILFFWVARMILMGEYAFNKPPFPEVFLHGLIYGKSYWRYNKDGAAQYVDASERLSYDLGNPVPAEVHSKWEKMSKSKGNIIDPLEIIDAYGTDAMRMALCASATHARQIDLDRRRFEEFKNFANKIWNGARFVFMNLETLDAKTFATGLNQELLTLEDRWILSLLNRTIREVEAHLTDYSFDKAAMLAYDFFWKEFCAYYLELTKPVLFGKTGSPEEKINKQKILVIALTAVVRLLHPMAPFITEELFQKIKERFHGTSSDPYTKDALEALSKVSCAVAPYPKIVVPSDIDPSIEEAFSFMDQIAHAVRNIRAEMQIPLGSAVDLFMIGDFHGPQGRLAKSHEGILRGLVKLAAVHYESREPSFGLASAAVVGTLKLLVPLPKELQEKEKLRLNKEQEKLVSQENQIRTQLSNQEFIAKAPTQLIDKLKVNLSTVEQQLVEVTKKLSVLSE